MKYVSFTVLCANTSLDRKCNSTNVLRNPIRHNHRNDNHEHSIQQSFPLPFILVPLPLLRNSKHNQLYRYLTGRGARANQRESKESDYMGSYFYYATDVALCACCGVVGECEDYGVGEGGG